jgi:hypothetical protein
VLRLVAPETTRRTQHSDGGAKRMRAMGTLTDLEGRS